MKTSTTNSKTLENRLARIESAIERNRISIVNGGDVKYYTRQILKLNGLAWDLEGKIESLKG